jgi:hypothetical protein
LVFGAALVFMAFLVSAVRPQCALMVPWTLLATAWLLRREGFARAGGAVLAPVALAGLLLWLPERALAKADADLEAAVRRISPARLLFWHIDILAADLRERGSARDPRDTELLRRLVEVYERTARHPEIARHYPVLGFNPDSLFYGEANELLTRSFAGRDDEYRAFCHRQFLGMLCARPMDYLAKIFRQLRVVYGWDAKPYTFVSDIPVAQRYEATLACLGWPSSLAPVASRSPSVRSYLGAVARLRDAPSVPAVEPPCLAEASRSWFATLNGFYSPATGIFCAAGLAWLLRGPRRLGALATTIGFLCASVLSTNLTVALVHSLDVVRYIELQLGLNLFVELGATLFVLGVVLSWRHRCPSC